MVSQSVINIAEIAYQKGIKHAVISPGSRSALISLAFARHSGIKTYILKDERSGGYFALGLALAIKEPVILVCTSGTALLNLYPAITEAYYQHIPLIVLSADRPPEWIGQNDGQTINQDQVLSRHVKNSFLFPEQVEHEDIIWHGQRMINDAINLAKNYPEGPVHINIPIREPFYPDPDKEFKYGPVKIIRSVSNHPSLNDESWDTLAEEWKRSHKVLIVSGQMRKDHQLLDALSSFTDHHQVAFLADVTANMHPLNTIHHDLLLNNKKLWSTLQPDLLITIGNSVLSKNLKQFLRKNRPRNHWHIDRAGQAADTYKSLSHIIHSDPMSFFEEGLTWLEKDDLRSSYGKSWKHANKEIAGIVDQFMDDIEFGEQQAAWIILKSLPEQATLHISNSFPIRLFNTLGKILPGTEVLSNRGTSGIDGCTSTMVGFSTLSVGLNILVTGDMAFLYDRNAFWNDHVGKNVRIIVLNNHGGGIFRMIEGPSALPELEQYFETNQPNDASYIAKEYGLDYLRASSRSELEGQLNEFFAPGDRSKILEIETDKVVNKHTFEKFKELFS